MFAQQIAVKHNSTTLARPSAFAPRRPELFARSASATRSLRPEGHSELTPALQHSSKILQASTLCLFLKFLTITSCYCVTDYGRVKEMKKNEESKRKM